MVVSSKNDKEEKKSKLDFTTSEDKASSKTVFSKVIADINAGKETIAKLLDEITLLALDQKASDIHIEPQETDLLIRFRIDGMLSQIARIDKNLEQSLIFRIKVAAKLRTDEHFAPQDGKIRFIFDNKRKLDTRISILPTTMGEKVVIRLLSQEGKSFDLSDMGLRGKELEIVQKAYKKPYGMILVTGPTGSGKTTTLYSILQLINSPEINITTIEDPVEYDIPGINHIQINSKAKLTFASGLRSILRQDPNVIMVGEIRDNETARIAINSAMTGHLVLSTLHTNDAVTTIPRLIDMQIEPFLVASTVNVVIAQRLTRKICENCKEEYKLSKEAYEEIKGYRPDIAKLIKIDEKFYKGKGCSNCNGKGYKGRIGLYEVLEINEEVRRIITDRTKNVDDIYQLARKQGLVLIVEDGINKVREGVTGIEEVIRVTALKE